VGETLFWDDNPAYRLANPAASEVRPAPSAIPTTSERPPLELDFYDRMNKTSLSNSDMGFGSNVGFSNVSADGTQIAKEVSKATNNTATSTSPNDAGASYSSRDYNEPRAVTIPNNNMDDGVSSAWIALDNSAYGAPSLDQALDGGFDLSNFNTWI
jgi:hypothetical protein